MDFTINIGLPKGRFLENSKSFECALLERFGDTGKRLNFYFLKARDIPQLISRGKLYYGITCDEWVAETNSELRDLGDTGWCYSNIHLVSPNQNFEITRGSHVASPFPNLTRAYFGRQNKHPVIEEVTGSGEFLVPFAYDAAVDVVETGGTIAKLGLHRVGEPILSSSTRVWANQVEGDSEVEEHIVDILTDSVRTKTRIFSTA